MNTQLWLILLYMLRNVGVSGLKMCRPSYLWAVLGFGILFILFFLFG